MEGKMNALLKTAAEPDAMEYVEDFDIPQIKDDEVLMEIKAVGICGTDHSLYRWNPQSQIPITSSILQSSVMSSLA